MTTFRIVFTAFLAVATASDPQAQGRGLTLSHLSGGVYVVEDSYYGGENSAVYIGDTGVTVIGATWTPETARLLSEEIRKVTDKPITDVINTNYHPDRAGGNPYFKSVGATVSSTKMTYDLLKANWGSIVTFVQKAQPDYPSVTLALPDKTFPGDFELQGGSVRAVYLGPSHTPDGIFVLSPGRRSSMAGAYSRNSSAISILRISSSTRRPWRSSRRSTFAPSSLDTGRQSTGQSSSTSTFICWRNEVSEEPNGRPPIHV